MIAFSVMNLNVLQKSARTSYFLRVMLSVVLVFSALHISTHDIDTSGDLDSNEHCQVCRLNHIPITDFPPLTLGVPLLALALVHSIPALHQPSRLHLSSFNARAPPFVLKQY